MKLKYYIRGLGVGIFFTTLLFILLTGNKKNELTESEIIQRALALGMVETKTSAITQPTETEIETETETQPETQPETEIETEPETESTSVSITIVRGMTSRHVANLLKREGIIQDAIDFDRYLINNGFSSRIRVGIFEIEKEASYEEIARKIT